MGNTHGRHGGRLRLRRGRTLLSLAAAATAVTTAATGITAAAAAAPRSTRYYLDCRSGSDSASGKSAKNAWHSLAKANAHTFKPGDSLLLARGTSCTGVLQPQGSGTKNKPITLSAYGKGARPAIVGGGARAAVFLHNVQGWTITHLDVSDPAPADGTPHVGIYVLLEDYGTGHDYKVEDVKVHDVPGCDCLDAKLENTGGVLFKAAGSSKPTGFDGIQVSRTTVTGVDNIGIGTLSQWSKRDLYPGGTGSFVGMTRVHVSANNLSNLGGDGVLVQNGVRSVEEYNRVDGFGLRATASHAGILAFNSEHAVIQHNEVTHGSAMPPSFAYSVDAANRDVTYQYNYGHDNAGPFMLFCDFPGTYGDGATVRYNISENDHSLLIGNFPIPVVANGCDDPIKNIQFYGNDIYSPNSSLVFGSRPHSPAQVSDNIFVGQQGATIMDPVSTFSHNLYSNVAVPSGDKAPVTADPAFVKPGGTPLGLALHCGSPAIGAGTAIAGNGGRDFFGFPIPGNSAPNIGAYQGPCVKS